MSIEQPLVFIVGCGRSGTSLLRSILNNHSKVFIPPECGFLTDYFLMEGSVKPRVLFSLLVNEPELRLWFKFKIKFDRKLHVNTASILQHIYELASKSTGKSYWGQKTPRFIRYYALFKKVYPDLKFIFVVRDPRATANSFVNSIGFTSYLPEIVNRWLYDNKIGRQLVQDMPDHTLIVKYEDLVKSTRSTVNRVTEFLKIDFEEGMLDYQSSASDYKFFKGKQLELIKKKPDENRINDWRNRLSPAQLSYIQDRCEGLMTNLGYSSEEVLVANKYGVRVSFFHKNLDRLRKLFLFLKYRPRFILYLIFRKSILSLLSRSFLPFSKV